MFLLPSNAVALLLLGINKKRKIKITSSIVLFFSYGTAPLLSGLIFYCLVWILPNRSNAFYIATEILPWITFFIFKYANIGDLFNIYRSLLDKIRREINLATLAVIFTLAFFLMLFTLQVFGFPIIDGDSANYINQGKALYENKNLNWKDRITTLDNNHDYLYNPMIGPGIPSFLAISFSIAGKTSDYFSYNFLIFYYYILLLLIFLFFIKKTTAELDKPLQPAIFFGSIFFVFSWIIARMLLMGAKEVIIYFLTLTSIIVIYNLLKLEKRDIFLEILLGILIGLNTFLNIHGIIISLILMFLLMLLSKLKFVKKLSQLLVIFFIYIVFSAFEFCLNFRGIFFPIIQFISPKVVFQIDNILKIFHEKDSVKINPDVSKIIANGSDVIGIHKELYHMKNFKDVYLKGKFQILTNIGIFGAYFWFFLLIVFKKIKEITKTDIGKILLFFIIFYFLIVLDPFNINKHPLNIILWGSAKYAGLVLFLSLIITSVYAWPLINKIFSFIVKKKHVIFLAIFPLLLSALVFRDELSFWGLKALSQTTPFYKNIEFYQNKVDIFTSCLILALVIFSISLMLIRANKLNTGKNIFVVNAIFVFVLVPFFMTSVGKVPLEKTFSYIGKNQRQKLEDFLNFNDVQKVYFFAKDTLPRGSHIETSFNELYLYDDYFHLTRKVLDKNYYKISIDCNQNILYSRGGIGLCVKD
jgi:hypothetical protein